MKARIFIVFLIVVSLVIFVWAELKPQFELQSNIANADFGSRPVDVMTYNIYVGADLDPIVNATDPSQIPFLVGNAVIQVLDTNFPERAEALAKIIGNYKPHLIGLQEVSIIELDPPVGLVSGFNYLNILLDALEDRNLHYETVGMIENINVEMPCIISEPPYYGAAHLVDYDVILARKGVEISDSFSDNYDSKLVTGFGLPIPRGYVAVTATIGRKSYRFVNTHLEPFDLEVQMNQAIELVEDLQSETLPIILVGDLNTEATTGETYQYLIDQVGFVDAWTRNRVRSNPDGYTSGQDPGLRNEESQLSKRIDLILVRNGVNFHPWQNIGPVNAFVVGDEQKDRTSSGLWPSDHAGVVAKLRIPVD